MCSVADAFFVVFLRTIFRGKSYIARPCPELRGNGVQIRNLGSGSHRKHLLDPGEAVVQVVQTAFDRLAAKPGYDSSPQPSGLSQPS